MLSLLVASLLLGIFLRCLYLLYYQYTSRLNCPGPEELPLLGNTLEVLRHFDDGYDWMTTMWRKWSIYQFYIPGQPRIVVVGDVKDVECLLKTEFSNFEKGETFRDRFTELLGNGIFNSDGKAWYEQRKTAVHMFSVRHFRDYSLTAFLRHGATMVDVFRRHAADGTPVDAQTVFYKYTLDSIGTIGFGKDLGCLSHERVQFADAFDYAQAVADERFFSALWPIRKWIHYREWKFRWCIFILNRFANDLVTERSKMAPEELAQRHDFLSLFMADTSPEGTKRSTVLSGPVRKYLRDVVLNFLIAGRDTTAGALTWTTWCLAEHPAVRDRVRAEMRHALAEANETPETVTYDTLWKKMPFLHAVIHEVLRLYPSVPKDAKTCVKETVLPSGVRIPVGTLVGYAPYTMGRMPSIWGEDAEEFKPERWLGTSEDGELVFKKRSQFEYVVFNAGPRLCLGMNMALLELKVAVVLLLSQFSLDTVEGHPVTYASTVTMPMKFGLKVNVAAYDL